MAVSSVTNTTPVTGTAGTTSGNSPLSSSTAAEQQDRFMKLLVAQMKNQDPLNPMDNAQMTSQIAQINTVGGIEKLNRTVEGLLSAFQGLQAQSASQLPGRSVLVAGNSLTLADGAATGGVELAGAASEVKVEILGGDGRVVQTVNMGPGEAGVRSFHWDGQRADGQAAPAGNYRLRVTAANGASAVQATALTAARVESVSNSASGVQLDLGAAGTKPYSDVKSFL